LTPSRKALLLALVVALLASCGGGGSEKVDPKTYVHDVCGAFLDWVNNVKQGSTQLQQLSAVGTSPADAKAALEKYIDRLVQETQTAVAKLQDAGVPDVPNGDSVRSGFVEAFQQVRDAFSQARDSISDLSTTSPAAFKAATEDLGSTLQTSLQGVGNSLNKIGEEPELVKASNADANCQQLNNL
jgi:hypothetical protein